MRPISDEVRTTTRALRVRTITRSPRHLLLQVSLLVLCLALPVSCATPTRPTDNHIRATLAEPFHRAGEREPYRTPARVLATIERAIEEKTSAGATAYVGSFSDFASGIGKRPFRAIYDPAVKAAWEATTPIRVPEPWDISLERGLPRQLNSIRPTWSYRFRWMSDPSANLGGGHEEDTTQIHRRYLLIALAPNDATRAAADTIAIGSCDLSLERTHGRWSIYLWVDHADPVVGVNPRFADQRSFSFWRLVSTRGF